MGAAGDRLCLPAGNGCISAILSGRRLSAQICRSDGERVVSTPSDHRRKTVRLMRTRWEPPERMPMAQMLAAPWGAFIDRLEFTPSL